MQMRSLGRTDIKVSSVCLGTMTWGEQNSEADAHEQLDYAVSRGINFIDTAEMYPVPGDPKTQGRTEEYIGSWLAARGKRDDVILATKITGRSQMAWTRKSGENPRHSPEHIDDAIEASLRRLQTDYIDLYQLHWPDRKLQGFGFDGYTDYDPDDMIDLEVIIDSLTNHIDKGNIRYIGLSNESPWGMMKFLEIAQRTGGPRIVSIQNVYSLLARRFDYGGAEIAMREDVGLLPYSPLAMGLLTGKYEGGKTPKGSRKDLFPGFLGRYERAGEAVQDCLDAARELGLTPTQFALKFAQTRDFVTSSIIGATTLDQLKENIDAHDIRWTWDMEDAAERIHARHRSPVASA